MNIPRCEKCTLNTPHLFRLGSQMVCADCKYGSSLHPNVSDTATPARSARKPTLSEYDHEPQDADYERT